jgi:hypothetical protein
MTAADDNVACRTVSYSVIMFILCWLCSLPRTFEALSKLGAASAAFTFISVLLATIFAGVEKHPAGYDPRPSYTTAAGKDAVGGDPLWTALPVAGTTFVAGMSAFLNISYTFIGQITLPSFIAEMKEPRYVELLELRYSEADTRLQRFPQGTLGLHNRRDRRLWPRRVHYLRVHGQPVHDCARLWLS